MAKRLFETFVDDAIYLPALSADGRQNAYYHRCEEVMHNAPYASCLDKIEQRKEGRLSSIYSVCSVAISKKHCPALEMRQQELLQGRAIFFLNREKMRAFYTDAQDALELPVQKQDIRHKPKRAERERPQEPVSSPTPAPTATPIEPENLYAAALNNALANSNQPTITKSPVSTGRMSLLEIARAKNAERGNA